MRIRAATSADIPSILQIEQHSNSAAHWPESTYSDAVCDPARVVLVAEEEDRVQGFLVASGKVAEWELENIAVSSALRRQGTGRRLISKLIERAAEAGAKEIRQEIRVSNEAALKLARSVGFVAAATRPNYYVDPQEDAVLLTLKTQGASE